MRVERALKAVPGVTQASDNLATEQAVVEGMADPAALIAAVERAGYPVHAVDLPPAVSGFPMSSGERPGIRSAALLRQ